jgi:hypothetical protein
MRWPILLLLAVTTTPLELPGQSPATKALSEVSAEVSLPAKGAAR